MKEKQFDPARVNDQAPAPGMAAVDTHNPGESESSGVTASAAKQVNGDVNDSDVSQDPNRFNAPDQSGVAAELNIRSDAPTGNETKNVEADVTPRNLEADSDGA